MRGDRYPPETWLKIEMSGNAGFLWYFDHFVRRTGKECTFERMPNLNESARALRELLAERSSCLTARWGPCCNNNLNAADFGGAALEGCNENLVRTRPDVVLDIHRKYLRRARTSSKRTASAGRRLCSRSMAGGRRTSPEQARGELRGQAADEFQYPWEARS